MTRTLRFITTCLFATLCFHGPGMAQELDSAPQNSGLNGEMLYELLVAEISAQGGDMSTAFALELNAARKANAPRLFERAIEMALHARSGDSALQAAQAWVRAFPASQDANRYQLQILIGLNRVSETIEPTRHYLASLSGKERLAAITMLPRHFARASDRKLAASTLEQALAGELSNRATGAAAWASVGQLRFFAGDAPGALEAVRRGVALDPTADEPVLLALGLWDVDTPAVEAVVARYLKGKPSPEVRMAYTRKLLDLQRNAEAFAQMLALTSQAPDFPQAWLVRGSLEFDERKWSDAQTSLEKYIALSEKTGDSAQSGDPERGVVQANLLLSQIAEQFGKLDEAQSFLDRIEGPQDALRVQTRRANILARQGKLDAARELIRNVPEAQPQDARAKISAEVQLLRDYKLYTEAYEMLTAAVAKYPQDVDLLYDQAMMAEKLDRLDEMEQQLRKLILMKPDYHHAYNALGYSLADRNLRLPEARQLINKALEFAPNDPFIVDSLGWLEFRSGNAQEALKLLQNAYRTRPDAEIAAHLGEVLWSIGQHNEASTIWDAGIGLNPASEPLLETIHRLRGNR